MTRPLRVLIADDERPARALLASLLATFPDVELVAEARDGVEAVQLIDRELPDLALLDLQMPEVDGLEVVRLLPGGRQPLVAFVTAYDEHAVAAFELNAVDYLLKPVAAARLRRTVDRALDRLERADLRATAARQVAAASASYRAKTGGSPLRSIPVRKQGEILLVPSAEIASIVADGELLQLTTARLEHYSINYRLKDLEARLGPEQFVRIHRGTLVNVAMIRKAAPMPGGSFLVTLSNGQQLHSSRSRSRVLRERLLEL